MRTCPNCKKEYADDLQYCLDDGTVLEGSKRKSEMETIVLPSEQSVVTKLVEPVNTTKKDKEQNQLDVTSQAESIDRKGFNKTNESSLLYSWSPRISSVLRIITGFLFLWHGSQKLFNYPPMPPMPGGDGSLPFLMLVAGILEFGGGLLFLLGLFTRPIAFILSGMMAVAYFMGHASGGFLPLVNGGELAVLYCFVFLYFVFAGGGEWSADNLIRKRD